MFERIRSVWGRSKVIVSPASDGNSSQLQDDTELKPPQTTTLSSDQPIVRREQDRFNRWPFAKRIAETIAMAADPSSIVVGVYGPWGDGKTSTLALMEAAWADNPNIIPIRFNSWQFGSEEQLLRAFFDTLADALGKSLTNRKEDIGKILKKYGAILSIASLDLAQVVKLDPGRGVVAIGEALSSVELDTLRGRLEEILLSCGKRAVILVDDIDRLDRSEIHAIFRLIKVSASFKNTSYVLAFDDEMVAAALGEKYGGGGTTAGRNFLEKIVHVPLNLPPAETIELRNMVFEGVDAVLSQQGIDLGREEAERFSRMFVDALQPQMTTPRQAKRYTNAILFAVPLLKGEVNSVDLMIVEAIRIFIPKLYATIRDNPSLFLGTSSDRGDTDKRVSQMRAIVDPALDGLGIINRDTVYRRLIEALFPRSGRTGYGSEWNNTWIGEQRICSSEYFGRYFSYSVPPGDVGDLEVRQFVDEISNESLNTEEIHHQMQRFADRRAMPGLLTKLRYREETIEAEPALRLAMAIAPHGALLPKEEGGWVFRTTVMQGAILIRKLLLRIPSSERPAAALAIIQKAKPLSFAAECLHWLRYFKEQSASERVLTPDAELATAHLLVDRIRSAAMAAPLYQTFLNDAPRLYWLWKEYGPPGELETHLRTQLTESRGVYPFLVSFLGRAWGVESGLSSRSDFDRNAYDRVADLISPTFVIERLRAEYGESLRDDSEKVPKTEFQWERHIARRFIALDQFVSTEKQSSADSSEETDRD